MEKRREAFELVIHIDEAGTRATASYRTRVFDDKGNVDTDYPPVIEPVTLANLGEEFPWADFVPAATKAALIAVDSANAAQKLSEQSATEAKAKVTEMLVAVDAATEQLTTQLKSLAEVKAKFAPVEAVSADPVK